MAGFFQNTSDFLISYNFSNPILNSVWNPKNSDFGMIYCSEENNLFLYYRNKEQSWVIDDKITSSGGCIAKCFGDFSSDYWYVVEWIDSDVDVSINFDGNQIFIFDSHDSKYDGVYTISDNNPIKYYEMENDKGRFYIFFTQQKEWILSESFPTENTGYSDDSIVMKCSNNNNNLTCNWKKKEYSMNYGVFTNISNENTINTEKEEILHQEELEHYEEFIHYLFNNS